MKNPPKERKKTTGKVEFLLYEMVVINKPQRLLWPFLHRSTYREKKERPVNNENKQRNWSTWLGRCVCMGCSVDAWIIWILVYGMYICMNGLVYCMRCPILTELKGYL